MTKRDYDNTVARIAGNLLSGYIARFPGYIPRHTLVAAVQDARAIVAEVKRTEPVADERIPS